MSDSSANQKGSLDAPRGLQTANEKEWLDAPRGLQSEDEVASEEVGIAAYRAEIGKAREGNSFIPEPVTKPAKVNKPEQKVEDHRENMRASGQSSHSQSYAPKPQQSARAPNQPQGTRPIPRQSTAQNRPRANSSTRPTEPPSFSAMRSNDRTYIYCEPGATMFNVGNTYSGTTFINGRTVHISSRGGSASHEFGNFMTTDDGTFMSDGNGNWIRCNGSDPVTFTNVGPDGSWTSTFASGGHTTASADRAARQMERDRKEFERGMREFGREMRQMGREMQSDARQMEREARRARDMASQFNRDFY